MNRNSAAPVRVFSRLHYPQLFLGGVACLFNFILFLELQKLLIFEALNVKSEGQKVKGIFTNRQIIRLEVQKKFLFVSQIAIKLKMIMEPFAQFTISRIVLVNLCLSPYKIRLIEVKRLASFLVLDLKPPSFFQYVFNQF